jgi:hypothetical protein
VEEKYILQKEREGQMAGGKADKIVKEEHSAWGGGGINEEKDQQAVLREYLRVGVQTRRLCFGDHRGASG